MSKPQWNAENLKPGEEYAGLILGKSGATDYHLILLPGQANDITWKDAKVWAETVGGKLPTLREMSLLIVNLNKQFEPRWYWSSDAVGATPGCAWNLILNDGYQGIGRQHDKFCARAVRRLPIGCDET
jgi:hypothetical protein